VQERGRRWGSWYGRGIMAQGTRGDIYEVATVVLYGEEAKGENPVLLGETSVSSP
jgi:hypothetical protein